MTGDLGADVAFAAGFVLRFVLIVGFCIACAALVVGRMPSARGGRHG